MERAQEYLNCQIFLASRYLRAGLTQIIVIIFLQKINANYDIIFLGLVKFNFLTYLLLFLEFLVILDVHCYERRILIPFRSARL